MRLEPITPKVTSVQIERLARREYPADQLCAVMTILKRCRPSDSDDFADRVRLAVLRLSAGRLGDLRRWVEVANYDSSELLARVESPGYRQIEVRIRNGKIPGELQQRIIEEDRIQYENWLLK